ncbi:unnamed protein product [Trichogramma brassicae]|uniref:CCHC-type domain-containing protein n=1 Tax=Trichogramma brassicae TaxID=86971 RepID=A0A6H5IDC3_9HYME|nr:unnamed protein product [Trichogramma brassicae]
MPRIRKKKLSKRRHHAFLLSLGSRIRRPLVSVVLASDFIMGVLCSIYCQPYRLNEPRASRNLHDWSSVVLRGCSHSTHPPMIRCLSSVELESPAILWPIPIYKIIHKSIGARPDLMYITQNYRNSRFNKLLRFGYALYRPKKIIFEKKRDGIGSLKVIPGGIELHGQAAILDALIASSVKSRRGSNLVLESWTNFTASARSDTGQVLARFTLRSPDLLVEAAVLLARKVFLFINCAPARMENCFLRRLMLPVKLIIVSATEQAFNYNAVSEDRKCYAVPTAFVYVNMYRLNEPRASRNLHDWSSVVLRGCSHSTHPPMIRCLSSVELESPAILWPIPIYKIIHKSIGARPDLMYITQNYRNSRFNKLLRFEFTSINRIILSQPFLFYVTRTLKFHFWWLDSLECFVYELAPEILPRTYTHTHTHTHINTHTHRPLRIVWVNCRIRAREEAARCYRCWSPGHMAARCKGPDRTELCYRCGQKGHQAKDCRGQPSSILCQERGADDHRQATTSSTSITARLPRTCFAIPSASCTSTWPSYVSNTRTSLHPIHGSPMPTAKQLSGCMEEFRCTEEARGRRPLVIAGDFNAWSTEWGCRETRPRASILLDLLALLDAVLLNTGDVPTFNATIRPSSSRSRTPGLPPGPRRARAADGTPVHSMGTVSLPPCPAHRSLPGPQRIWRRASCPSSPAHVMPRCPRSILAAVVSRCTGGRPRSLISGAPACGLADSSRDKRTKKPTARTTPPQGIFCAWRSRPASVGAGGSFATRSTATSGANHTRLPCRACDARRPSSPAPLSWCAARWRLCSRGCRAGPPCSCRIGRRSLYQPSPWRNSKELSRGSRSAPRPARMAYPTQRSKSLLPPDPKSSCGCTRRVWRPAFFHLAESARGLSCFQNQVNLLTSRLRIVRCVCWTQRARFYRESYATGWKLSQRDPEASRSDSRKGDQR